MKALTLRFISIPVLIVVFLTAVICFGQDTAEQIVAKGVEYAADGKFQDAKEEFEKALKVEPFYESAKSTLKVIEDVNSQKIKTNTAIIYFKGVSYVVKGRWAEAISDFNKAIEINPRDVLVYYNRGNAYLEEGNSTVTAANWYGARMIPLQIDTKIKNKEKTFQIGDNKMVAHHCPGHSPGSVVYLAELNSTLVLFGQDVHGPLDASFLSNRDDYLRSLKFMVSLDADILCEGHFGIYQGKSEINQFIQTYLEL